MKIAIHDYFTRSGETTIANNLVLAGQEMGLDVRRLTSIQDIDDFAPDCVVYLPHYAPKMTKYPSYMGLTTPIEHALNRDFQESMLSYDGYLCVPGMPQQFAEDLCFGTDKVRPVACFLGQRIIDFPNRETLPTRLIYCGQNWDNRHIKLLELLSQHDWFDVYGPENSWKGSKVNYRGEIPYEGDVFLEVHHKAGVGLALQNDLFVARNIPTGRIFEVSSVGSLAIAPHMPFIHEHYGDSVLYVDQSADPQTLYKQIVSHMDWVRNNNKKALEMAEKAREITAAKFSAKNMLEILIAYHKASMEKGGWSWHGNTPEVAVIVRAGGRSLDILKRCFDSLKNQVYKNIRPVVVLYKPLEGLQAFLDGYKDVFSKIDVVKCMGGIRSKTLWAGLNHVYEEKIPYFGILDDDDEYFPNHISNLLQTIQNDESAKWAYALTVTQCHDQVFQYQHVTENRHIKYYPFMGKNNDLEGQWIHPAGTLVSTCLLDTCILQDPVMHTAEDSYLWRQLFIKNQPVPSFRCTSMAYVAGDGSGFLTHPFRQLDLLKLKTRFLGKRWHDGRLITTNLNLDPPYVPRPTTFLGRVQRLVSIMKKIMTKGPRIIRVLLSKIDKI